jgi:hypothetical protein
MDIRSGRCGTHLISCQYEADAVGRAWISDMSIVVRLLSQPTNKVLGKVRASK